MNGDGIPDVVVGAPFVTIGGGAGARAAWVVFGKGSPEAVYLGALGDGGFRIDAAPGDGLFGLTAAEAGDVDGLADVILGSRRSGHNDRPDSGSAYVVLAAARRRQRTSSTPRPARSASTAPRPAISSSGWAGGSASRCGSRRRRRTPRNARP